MPPDRPPSTSDASAPSTRRVSDAAGWLPLAALVVAVVAALPPFAGPHLDTAHRAEIADHFVPAVVVLAVSGAVLLAAQRARLSEPARLGAGLVVLLAGLWMVATHLPVVAQALRDEAPWGATAYHSATALLVLLLGLAWVKWAWPAAT